MRNGTYYAIAALLVLATVPMYRYIFHRARELDLPSPPSAVVYASSPPVAMSPASSSRMPLLPGEICVGGVVVLVSGSTYTQTNGADGRPVRCDGTYTYR